MDRRLTRARQIRIAKHVFVAFFVFTLLLSGIPDFFSFLTFFKSNKAHAAAFLTQDHYWWYSNLNGTMPTTTLAFEDASTTSVVSGTVLRLRMNVAATSSDLATGTVAFKLQYQANATSGAWTDVGASSSASAWRTSDNASALNGAVVSSTLIPESNVFETYQESNPSTSTPNALTVTSTAPGLAWSQATSSAAWSKRYGHTSLVYNGKMWVMGGIDASSTYYNDVWSSTDGITWTQATSSAAWAKRSSFTSLVYNNKMWVMGGTSSTYMNDVWSSTDGITWTQATSSAAWPKRAAHTSLVYNNKMWVMGGTSSTYMNDVWSSSDGITWTQATSSAAWVARLRPTSLVYNNKIWIMGGASTTSMNDVWSSTDGINWTKATSSAAWAARYRHTSLVYNGKMWVMGGTGGVSGITNMNDVWFSTDGITWTQATSAGAWAVRGYHTSLVYNGKMWVMGGYDNNLTIWMNDVWSSTGNGVGEWDWTLQHNGAVSSTTYYFRMIQSSGTALDSYNNYPVLSTAGVTSLTQDHYQWFSNVNDTSPTSTLALEDASTTSVASGTILRLRVDASAAGLSLATSTQFKLQFQANATSGSWTDVGASSSATIWRHFDNASATDKATVPYMLLPESNIFESYQESSPSTSTPNQLTTTSTSPGITWSKATSSAAWAIRYHYSSLVYNSKMWVMGGLGAANKNDVWSSTDGITWTQATSSAAWSARTGQTSVVYNNKMWLIGGYNGTNDLNDVWSSTDGITWSQATSSAAWAARDGHASIIYNNKMWVIGGQNNSSTNINDVWSSTDGITWVQATSSAAWSGRYHPTSLVYNNKMWVIGGQTSSTYRNDVWSSTDGITWVQTTSSAAWAGRRSHTSLVYNNKMWVMGGASTTYMNDVWSSSDGITWTVATSSAAWAARRGHTSLAYAGKMWVMGGASTTQMNDVWSSTGNAEGEWDWTLQQNGASSTATYYFRMINNNGNALDVYNNYPLLKTATTTIQDHYQWWTNANDVSPTSSLALEDASTTNVISGATIRLRMNVSATSTNLASNTQFKLQFQASATSGAWTDVGASSSAVIWRSYDNASATDQATLPYMLLPESNISETYQETNPSTSTPNQLTTTSTNPGVAWSQATSGAAWAARDGHTSVVYNNKMWVMGGTVGGDRNDIWSSTDGITWTQATSSAAWIGRHGHTSLIYNNKMWVMGGIDASSTYRNDVWSSTDGITWTQATSSAAWAARYRSTSAVYNNKMWILGGQDASSTYRNDVWSSTDGITWTQATSSAAWIGRYGPTSLVYNNKMWMIGGFGTSTYRNDVWSSSDGITWTQATSSAAWQARYEHISLVFNNKMWVMGGASSSPMNDVWSSSDGITWTQATSSAAWDARCCGSSLVYNSKMWILGGNAGGLPKNDVWSSTGNGVGEWDWTLNNNGAADGTTYYFRMINNNGTALDVYNNYPQLKTQASVLTQEHYQWWANANDVSPTSSLAFEDTSATSIASGTAMRLRMAVSATSTSLSTSTQFKLQFQASATSGAWSDVGATSSAVAWRLYDNASTTDGAVLPYMLLPESNISQTYQEANPSISTPSQLTVTSTAPGLTWTQATSSAAWGIRKLAASVVYNNKMWVMGGIDASSTYYNDVWSSTDGITWTQATSSAAWSARYWHVSVIYNNKMWLMGGQTSSTVYKNDVWSSSDGITWTQATSSAAWTGRSGHTSLVYNNKMWVMGGVSSTYMNDVWSSSDGITWTVATSSAAWTARRSHTSLVYNNKMWVMGGWNGTVYMNDVWSSTDGITWTQATSSAAWTGRSGHTSLVYNNKMWVMGGYNASDLNDVWSSTDGITWTQATSSAAWTGRSGHTSLVYNNKMWVMGGQTGITYKNDVWSSTGNGVGEWDWTLQHNGAASTTTYYFRMINNNGNVLDTYTNYPVLTTAGSGGGSSTVALVGYRWFNNADSTSVPSVLNGVAKNTSTTAPTAGTAFRLRLLLNVTGSVLATSTGSYKLQFAARSGSCDTGYSGESYTDVATSSGVFRFYDNPTPADGAVLTASSSDPTYSTSTVITQTYEEANNFSNTSTIPVASSGEWDFPLVNNSASSSFYCFRVVNSDGSSIGTPTVIPEISVLPATGSINSTPADTGISSGNGPAYNAILWKGTLPVGGPRVRFQFASSNSSSGPWTFIGGPTCTGADWYDPGAANTPIELSCAPANHNNQQYYKYKIQLCSAADCTSAGGATPTVTSVVVNWSP